MVKVLIMSGYGINCETESAFAFEKAGAEPDIVHINDIISGKKKMSDYDIMFFPGGFSYGDDTGSGNAFANKIKNNLWDALLEFIGKGKLIFGVCNGFQVMTHLGLFSLPSTSYGERISSLESNTQNRYECRWVNIRSNPDTGCVFTKGIDMTHLPIAHGEGRFYCDEKTLQELKDNNQVVFTYCDKDRNPADGTYPVNPNGAISDIAGICDKSGKIMGMMPHPERAIFSTSEPEYHKRKALAKKDKVKIPEFIDSNLKIFKNAVEFFG